MSNTEVLSGSLPPQTASAVVSANEIDMNDENNQQRQHQRAYTSHIPEEKTDDYQLTDQASSNQVPATAAMANKAFPNLSPDGKTTNSEIGSKH